MGTHNVHRAAALLAEARAVDGPIVEILDAAVIDDHAMFPSALPARRETSYNAWVTIQIGCDNNCAFCIVPAVRGAEISRPYADIVAEVEAARR
jgi:tRNA-2-methylthio-N6-dimethylallyladenosine synthase